VELREIEALLHLFERSSLTEMVIEGSGMRLTFKRQDSSLKEPLPKPGDPEPTPGKIEAPVKTGSEGKVVVRSPCVGTFSCRPKLGSEPFVKVGDPVTEEDTLAVVEAMKVLTEVKAAQRGVVEQILVEDGQRVEYGQELVLISPLST
jgi:acetyl-CoA carboxylase biotin carboxyl carrier protein